jgi:hypothetical protein
LYVLVLPQPDPVPTSSPLASRALHPSSYCELSVEASLTQGKTWQYTRVPMVGATSHFPICLLPTPAWETGTKVMSLEPG